MTNEYTFLVCNDVETTSWACCSPSCGRFHQLLTLSSEALGHNKSRIIHIDTSAAMSIATFESLELV